MIERRVVGIITTLAIVSSSATAHHGVSGQFDINETFDLTGTITRVRLVNPHAYVYFDVEDESGETLNMRCELSSGSLLKRRGWSADMFEIGSEITINGSPDHDDPTTCHMNQITFDNGVMATRDSSFEDDGSVVVEARQIQREDGAPNIEGNWAMVRPEADARGRRHGDRPRAQLTDAGEAAVMGARPEDNPRFNCQTTNIILDWTFNEMVNTIAQSETEIVLTYGFMDLVRTIHLDESDMPADFEPNRAGYSTGKWEGDTLIVTTTGFDEGWIMAPIGGPAGTRPGGNDTPGIRADRPEPPEDPRAEGGRGGPQPVKNSTQLTVTERFTLSDDGTVLTREYAFTDPLFLEAPMEGSDEVVLTTDASEPYACDDLTNERTL